MVAWPEATSPTVVMSTPQRGAGQFDRFGSIGIEEEFYLVDEGGYPAAGIGDLLEREPPTGILADRIDHELFEFTIETQTPVIADMDAVPATIERVRAGLIEYAAAHDYRILCAGLHPTARWWELPHTDKPRYRSQLERIQYPQHRNITSGLHIHIGVDDPDAAVWIANQLRWYVAPILAIGVNSPFWCGADTGLASARASIFEALPNTGMPGAFDSFAAFDRFERRMVDSGQIRDRGELWYDVRPHTAYGTVELRAPDVQTDPARSVAIVEYVHALVGELREAYTRGEQRPMLRREELAANKWQAMRYGADAALIVAGADEPISTRELLYEEAERFGLTRLEALVDAPTEASTQREIHGSEGFDALTQHLLLDPPG